ncbi:MmgE/PrpD family protein [Amycolatopsis sp. FDAARGOS 1241]|uniref:MmgE/PrpD family protein n=1 Tax=Amycolatopsis sp. FDAARGOS 1241 TaxID=2778070 RepID=UPI00194F130F|nr:MmgE/PrpD family protein [Amycolatopsis sp. FDAARGOS 1241]QRP42837.1 MmgE/PrpD family protein [Amycolatopsis sp. FDAARGOS 1241]
MAAVTHALAEFVHSAPSPAASPRAAEVVRHAVLDLAGVVVAGASEAAGRLALDYARSQGGAGAATVFGGRTRLSPSLAALVNGTAGHALDYDDIGLGAGHISVAILPALWAVAEQTRADGAAFTDAVVVAYEIAHRLTTMYSDTRLGPYAAGYHKPSVYSSLGAAAGCARLLDLSPGAVAHALGIAASQSGGLRANFGTMTKPLHAGIAGRTGVEAALLASSGFTASSEILEQRFGWHDVICRAEGDLDVVLDALDSVGVSTPYAVEEGMTFKAYPCCGANHYAIDGVRNVLRDTGLGESDVASLDVWIERRNLEDVLVYPWARTPLEGKFSLAYTVTAALVDGAVTVETFTDEALARLAPHRGRVAVHPATDLPQNGARIKLVTTAGRTVEHEQLTLRGSVADPMSWDELAAKFHANTRGTLSGEAASGAVALIAALPDQPDLTQIGALLLG